MAFAAENPTYDVGPLTPGTVELWCINLLEALATSAFTEAQAWLDRIVANPEGMAAITHPARDLTLETMVANAWDLINGYPIETRFTGRPAATLEVAYAVHCRNKNSPAQLIHERPDETTIVAVLTVCGRFAARSWPAHVPLLFRMLYYAQLGDTGPNDTTSSDCFAAWFGYWMEALATGTYTFSETGWEAANCSYRLLIGLPE